MLLQTSKRSLPYLLIALLLVWFSIIPALNARLSQVKTHTSASPIMLATPSTCNKSQTPITKLCQLSKLQYYVNLSTLIKLLPTLAEKLFFIYIIGLYAIGLLSQLFKPPKFQLAL